MRSTSFGLSALALLITTGIASAQTVTTLYNFPPSSGAEFPNSLVAGPQGSLIGSVAPNGGDFAEIFQMVPPASPGGAWTENVLYTFPAADLAALGLVATSQAVYGATYYGGISNPACLPTTPQNHTCGTVFSLTPPSTAGGSWTFATIYSFTGGTDGMYPDAIAGGDGALYVGTYGPGGGDPCPVGGPCGTVIQLTPPTSAGGTWNENTIYAFTAEGDGNQVSSLLVTKGGKVVVGALGDNANGVVIELTPPASSGGAWSRTILYRFPVNSHVWPYGRMVEGAAGQIYGVTGAGGIITSSGTYGMGTVFELTPPSTPGAGWTEQTIYEFQGGTDGESPLAGLTAGPNGKLYGTTMGSFFATAEGYVEYSNSTIFSLTPPATTGGTWTESVVYLFSNPALGCDPGLLVPMGGAFFSYDAYGGTGQNGTIFELN